MESELSGIFRVKVLTKNVAFAVAMSLFEETYKLSDQTVSAVPVKQYSSLIDVKNVIFSG